MNKLTTSQTRYILYGVLLLLLIISLVILCKIFLLKTYLDFNFYYNSLIAYNNAQNPYFKDFLYPPLAILLLLPFTIFPLFMAAKVFTIISVFCLLVSLFILFKLFKIAYVSNAGILILILTCNYFPIKYTLANGQINTIILLLVVLFMYCFVKKRDTLAGLILVITVSLKLFPPFIFPYLIFIKKYSIIKSFIFSLLIISIFVLILIPLPVIYSYFTSILPLLFHEGGGIYYFDQSLSAFLARSINRAIASQITKPLSVMILFLNYAILWKYRTIHNIELLSISILIILNIILSNFAWQHHFIWLLVPYIISFIYIRDNLLAKKFYGILAISYFLTATNIPNPRIIPPVFQSHVFYGAVILYSLLMYFIITQSKTIQLQKNKPKKTNKLIPKTKTK